VCKDQQDQAKMDRNFISMLLLPPQKNIHSKVQRFKDITEIQLQVVLDSITKWEIHGHIQQWKKYRT
jgi:hypothetical protein